MHHMLWRGKQLWISLWGLEKQFAGSKAHMKMLKSLQGGETFHRSAAAVCVEQEVTSTLYQSVKCWRVIFSAWIGWMFGIELKKLDGSKLEKAYYRRFEKWNLRFLKSVSQIISQIFGLLPKIWEMSSGLQLKLQVFVCPLYDSSATRWFCCWLQFSDTSASLILDTGCKDGVCTMRRGLQYREWPLGSTGYGTRYDQLDLMDSRMKIQMCCESAAALFVRRLVKPDCCCGRRWTFFRGTFLRNFA